MKLVLILCTIPCTCALAQNNNVTNFSRVLLPHTPHHRPPERTPSSNPIPPKKTRSPLLSPFRAHRHLYQYQGGVADRFAPGVEFGRNSGIFDIGLATEQLNAHGKDTVRYLEFRPTLNIFFHRGASLKAYALAAALSLAQGYVFYNGTNSNRSARYMGFSFTDNYKRDGSRTIRDFLSLTFKLFKYGQVSQHPIK